MRLWVQYQSRVYAYIRALVFRRADAEDILQEVAVVLWRKYDQFEPGSRFDQWRPGQPCRTRSFIRETDSPRQRLLWGAKYLYCIGVK